MPLKSQTVVFDEIVFNKAEAVFSRYGLSVERAVNIFIDRAVTQRKFPLRNIPEKISSKLLLDDEYNVMDLVFDSLSVDLDDTYDE